MPYGMRIAYTIISLVRNPLRSNVAMYSYYIVIFWRLRVNHLTVVDRHKIAIVMWDITKFCTGWSPLDDFTETNLMKHVPTQRDSA